MYYLIVPQKAGKSCVMAALVPETLEKYGYSFTDLLFVFRTLNMD